MLIKCVFFTYYSDEYENMQNILINIQNCYKETKEKKNQQLLHLDEIKTSTASKINENKDILNSLANEYLRTLKKLQNQISKLEALSYFEDKKLKLVSTKQLQYFLKK